MNPRPRALWIWIGLTGFGRGGAGGRAGAARGGGGAASSLAAVPLCLLSAALVLNLWVGYFPTVQTAWNQLTAGPLPDQTDQATVTAMQQQRRMPAAKGSVVPVDIPARRVGFQAPR